MKFSAQAQSSTAISVNWQAEPEDRQYLNATVNQFDPNGVLTTQSPLPPDMGPTVFGNLRPSTTYTYQWCGTYTDMGGGESSACLPDIVSAKTLDAPRPPGPPPPHPPPPGRPTTLPAGPPVQAQPKPFGRMSLRWDWTAGGLVSIIRLDGGAFSSQRTAIDLPIPYPQGAFVDVGPLMTELVYSYDVYLLSNGQEKISLSNPVTYPRWFSFRATLPQGFNPSLGTKSLRPNDHPFVSVRAIMSST